MEEAALPGNFGLDTHILKYPPQNFGISNFNTDYAKYLLTLISTIPARYKDIADSMEGNFTPLSARKMKEKVFNYSQYWVYFEQTGIVEIDKTYRSKQYSPDNPKCKGYRFKAKYDRSEVIYSNYSQAFKRKLKANGVEKYKKWKKEYGHLLVWLWSKNELKIETPTAHLYVEVRRQAQRENPELIGKKRHPQKHYVMKKDPDKQMKYAKANIRAIERKESNFEIDEKRSGRLFSVLTNMKGDLRNLISYGKRQLVSIDLKNSQPYLSTMLLKGEFYEDEGRIHLKVKERGIKLTTEETAEKIKELKAESPMLLYRDLSVDNQDVELYKSLVSDSNEIGFYEYMLQESKVQGRKNNHGRGFKDRDAAKVGMFEVFFSKNSSPGSAKKLFAKLFPTVNRIFEWIKSKEKGVDDKEGHSLLAMILQNIESTLILKIITKELADKYKTMPMYTIHDSIIVPVEYADKVKGFMEEKLTKIVGLRPTLKVEIWSPKELDWNKYLYP